MNTNRLLVGLVIALVIAFLLSSFVYKQFQKASIVKPTSTQNLVVAAVPLPLGTRLDASNLRVIQWPANQPVAGMFSRIEDVANRAIVTPLAENEAVIEGKLAPIPGTMVDVLVTGRIVSKDGGQGDVTRTILENIRVLAAGQKVQQDREGKPQTVAVITLLVTPDEASKLTMAANDGKIQLALRNTVDAKKNDPPTVLQSELFTPGGPKLAIRHSGSGKKSAAPPAPPPPYIIEVITGNKRENKSFPNTKDH